MADSKLFVKCHRLLLLLSVLVVCGVVEGIHAKTSTASILTVTKSGTGDGSVTADPGSLSWSGNTGTASYAAGTMVTLMATPYRMDPYRMEFGGWYHDGAFIGQGECLAANDLGECIQFKFTFTMPAAPSSVTAEFTKPGSFLSCIAGTITPAFGGAVVMTSESYSTTLPDGSFFIIHDPGVFTLDVMADGCTPYSASVTVVEMQTTNVTIDLDCSWTSTLLSSTGQSFPSDGGTGNVDVTIPDGYSWMATSNAGWVAITSGDTVTGNGMVSYSVTANASGTPRTGNLTIAGQLFTVTQANVVEILRGDINGNGAVDLIDAILTMQVLSGFAPSQPIHKNRDVDGNASLGLQEVIFIFQRLSGLRN
jgi:hypothetical protein